MPRLLMILAVGGGPADLGSAVDSDAIVTIRRTDAALAGFASAHDWTLADLAVLAAGQGAESEGFDAVCLGDFGDYGAGALRSVLRVPVVAAGRSAMLHALTLGSRFSVLVPAAGYTRAKKLVTEYGLAAQCASVRAFPAAEGEQSGPAFAAALTAAKACVEEDGADVLCLASTGDDLAAQLAAELPVPVIDPARLTLKLAESFLGLGLSQSRRSWPEPQVRKPELVEALVAAARRVGAR
ncbi:aspartate/glutamate racemase family protein [Bosea sp. (in: a-proteobacteria)]|uniref:aspartate/glutamate racemase family protein n=1 Tax=Bosea sp. (in: a-proteobacteria) TaxID=1871050 RepID=UPI002FC76765